MEDKTSYTREKDELKKANEDLESKLAEINKEIETLKTENGELKT